MVGRIPRALRGFLAGGQPFFSSMMPRPIASAMPRATAIQSPSGSPPKFFGLLIDAFGLDPGLAVAFLDVSMRNGESPPGPVAARGSMRGGDGCERAMLDGDGVAGRLPDPAAEACGGA